MTRDVSSEGRTITVRIPMRLQWRRGRRVIVGLDGGPWAPPRHRVDSALVKALARAHRWKRMIESGRYGSLTELAEAEKINRSYLCRILRLTLLAPDVVEAILDGRATVQLAEVMGAVPVEWNEQHTMIQAIDRAPVTGCDCDTRKQPRTARPLPPAWPP